LKTYGKKKLLALALSLGLAFSFMTPAQAGYKEKTVVYIGTPCQTPTAKFFGVKKLTKKQLQSLLWYQGFRGKTLKTAWAIVMKESRGNPLSHNYNPRTGDDSYVLFQINLYGSLRARLQQFHLKSSKDLTNPVINVKLAYYMSDGGKNFGSWKVGPGGSANTLVKRIAMDY
jgi:hypothetical protein